MSGYKDAAVEEQAAGRKEQEQQEIANEYFPYGVIFFLSCKYHRSTSV